VEAAANGRTVTLAATEADALGMVVAPLTPEVTPSSWTANLSIASLQVLATELPTPSALEEHGVVALSVGTPSRVHRERMRPPT